MHAAEGTSMDGIDPHQMNLLLSSEEASTDSSQSADCGNVVHSRLIYKVFAIKRI